MNLSKFYGCSKAVIERQLECWKIKFLMLILRLDKTKYESFDRPYMELIGLIQSVDLGPQFYGMFDVS